MAGELFQHVEMRVRLRLGEVDRDVDLLELLAGAIDEGPLQGEVDEAGDLVVLQDRQLPRHQGDAGRRLQRFEQLAHIAMGLVDLVDEQRPGHAQAVELGQKRTQQHRLVGIRIGDHHRHVGGGHGEVGFRLELHRTWAVDQGVVVVHEVEAGDVQFDRLAPGPRFRAGIPDRGPRLHRALSIDRAGGEQQRFHQAGLARPVGSHQRDGSRESSCSLGHSPLLLRRGARRSRTATASGVLQWAAFFQRQGAERNRYLAEFTRRSSHSIGARPRGPRPPGPHPRTRHRAARGRSAEGPAAGHHQSRPERPGRDW